MRIYLKSEYEALKKQDEALKYEVYVKFRGKWTLVAKCKSEWDARLVAEDRAKEVADKDGVQGVKVEDGEKLILQLG